MIRIGFVDYYLDEWHATNYPAMFVPAAAAVGVECEVVGALATCERAPFDGGLTTDEWCKKMGIKRYDDIGELAAACDAFIIFAPDSPEEHPALARMILPFGKPTFIDKTFAEGESDAREMIALAKEYGTPMYSTSSLRYASEVEERRGARRASVCGNYAHMKDYLVHTGEMVVTVLGTGIRAVECRKEGATYHFEVEYTDDRRAMVEMAPDMPFAIDGVTVKSDFFGRQIENILRFFAGEEPTVTENEMLEVARFIDMAKCAMERAGE